jgi:hypothetical protein
MLVNPESSQEAAATSGRRGIDGRRQANAINQISIGQRPLNGDNRGLGKRTHDSAGRDVGTVIRLRGIDRLRLQGLTLTAKKW